MPPQLENLLKIYREELEKVTDDRVKKVILYGSYARGDFRPDSDLDVMVLVDACRYVLSQRGKRGGSYLNKTESEGTFADVARYKWEQAKDDLETAEIVLEAGKYKAANNRAYYSCYHAIDAVLAIEPIAFKKHKDTLGYFNKNYVNKELFSREIGRKISRLEVIRHKSDFEWILHSNCEGTEQLRNIL